MKRELFDNGHAVWRSRAAASIRPGTKSTWETCLHNAGVPYFRLYDLRSVHATRLRAGGGADEWVTQMLRQTDAKMFKK